MPRHLRAETRPTKRATVNTETPAAVTEAAIDADREAAKGKNGAATTGKVRRTGGEIAESADVRATASVTIAVLTSSIVERPFDPGGLAVGTARRAVVRPAAAVVGAENDPGE